MIARRFLLACVLVASVSCRKGSANDERQAQSQTLVFRHQPLWGEMAPFERLLREFEQAHPGWKVISEPMPNSSDSAHQYFLTALEGGVTDFDAFVLDVVWLPEFARAGWVADLSALMSIEALERDFIPGAASAVQFERRLFALPWYVDSGLLYYRTDLVPEAPKTYDDLRRMAKAAMEKDRSLQGYVWQGRQYEGLVCVAYEAMWGHGGSTLEGEGGRLALDSEGGRKGLAYLRQLIAERISPASVTSAAEEETRRAFQNGQAVFMRNWPYAWTEAQAEGSKIKGKVGVSALPTEDGAPGAGTLGGWHLAVNAHAPPMKRAMAAKLIAHLTSLQSNVVMAKTYGRNPPRRAAYDLPELKEANPFIATLRPIVERARPRPVTPYYLLLSDVLQGEFSAAISGIRTPEQALKRAQKLADHRMGL